MFILDVLYDGLFEGIVEFDETTPVETLVAHMRRVDTGLPEGDDYLFKGLTDEDLFAAISYLRGRALAGKWNYSDDQRAVEIRVRFLQGTHGPEEVLLRAMLDS